MRIKYIGTCNKQDSVRGVGLHWEPGDERNVTEEVGHRLLHYRDTWIKADSQTSEGAQIGLTEDEKPTEEPLPVVDFHSMTKDEMVDYAEKNYGEKLDKRQTADTLREKLVGLFGKYELDNEGKK
jgi:hypothetical protein